MLLSRLSLASLLFLLVLLSVLFLLSSAFEVGPVPLLLPSSPSLSFFLPVPLFAAVDCCGGSFSCV